MEEQLSPWSPMRELSTGEANSELYKVAHTGVSISIEPDLVGIPEEGVNLIVALTVPFYPTEVSDNEICASLIVPCSFVKAEPSILKVDASAINYSPVLKVRLQPLKI